MKRNSAWCAVLVFLFAIGISAQTSFANVLGPGTPMWTLAASQGTTRTGTLALRGGGRSSYSIAQVVPIAANMNVAFAGGPPTAFARGHLVHGASPWPSHRTVTIDQLLRQGASPRYSARAMARRTG